MGCTLGGLYALRVDAEVDWGPDYSANWAPAVLAGHGVASMFVLADLADGTATLHACGIDLPPTSSLAGSSISGTFSDALWDDVTTTWTATMTTACDQPGCAFTSSLLQPQLGLDVPPGATWPVASSTPPTAELRDDDGDGRPGVPFALDTPLRVSPPGGYGAGWLVPEQVTELSLALRMTTQLHGALDSCGRASGAASHVELETRVLACSLESGSECLDDQAAQVRRSFPVSMVGTASWELVRLQAGSDCASARAALH